MSEQMKFLIYLCIAIPASLMLALGISLFCSVWAEAMEAHEKEQRMREIEGDK